jgi:hypothetical protein
MSATPLTIQGTVNPDGSLALDEKITLPPGRVQVTLAPLEKPLPPREDTWSVLERIWKENEALGLKPRSREEIDADINALRDELEEHANQVEALQEQAQRSTEKPGC